MIFIQFESDMENTLNLIFYVKNALYEHKYDFFFFFFYYICIIII